MKQTRPSSCPAGNLVTTIMISYLSTLLVVEWSLDLNRAAFHKVSKFTNYWHFLVCRPSFFHITFMAVMLVAHKNIFYSACRRRGGALKCPRFCFFFFGVESWAAAHGLYCCAVYRLLNEPMST